jgi:hypothetical protein
MLLPLLMRILLLLLLLVLVLIPMSMFHRRLRFTRPIRRVSLVGSHSMHCCCWLKWMLFIHAIVLLCVLVVIWSVRSIRFSVSIELARSLRPTLTHCRPLLVTSSITLDVCRHVIDESLLFRRRCVIVVAPAPTPTSSPIAKSRLAARRPVVVCVARHRTNNRLVAIAPALARAVAAEDRAMRSARPPPLPPSPPSPNSTAATAAVRRAGARRRPTTCAVSLSTSRSPSRRPPPCCDVRRPRDAGGEREHFCRHRATGVGDVGQQQRRRRRRWRG